MKGASIGFSSLRRMNHKQLGFKEHRVSARGLWDARREERDFRSFPVEWRTLQRALVLRAARNDCLGKFCLGKLIVARY